MGEIDVLGTCALCRKTSRIRKSHIIPKFVGDWLKRTSAAGYVAYADRGDKREQDLHKVRLLCDGCEERFSKHENYFSYKIFHPYCGGSKSFEYGRSLELFAVSLSWRSLRVMHDWAKSERPDLAPRIDKAESRWRSFLLGEAQDAGPYESHLVFLGGPESAGRYLGGSDWYKLRSTDIALYMHDDRVFAYSKLPRMFIVTAMSPPGMREWNGTEVETNGTIATSQLIGDAEFREFFRGRVQLARTLSPGPSTEQIAKRLEKAIRKDPRRVLGSESAKIMIRDADEERRKKMRNMPESVRELVEHLIQTADDLDMSENHGQDTRLAVTRIADAVAALPDDESGELDLMIDGVMREFVTTQKRTRNFFQTDSLQVVFIAGRNVTKDQQQSEIQDELHNLQRRQDAQTPIIVFFLNFTGDGGSFESGFAV